MSLKSVVEQIYQDYEDRNLQNVVDALPDEFCFEWPVNSGNHRYMGVCEGKQAFVDKMDEVAKDFEFHAYRPSKIVVDGETVAAQIQVALTSVHSGQKIDMQAAHFWTFKQGKPVKLTEYFDSALIEKHSA